MKKNIIKAYLIVGFFIGINYLSAQDQKIADSLKIILNKNSLSGNERLDLLFELALNERNDLNLSLRYSDILINESKASNNIYYLSMGYNQKGSTLRILGNLNQALDAFFKVSELASESKNNDILGTSYVSIADVYSEMGNSSNARLYYLKAIKTLRKTDNKIILATALLNAGDEAFNLKEYKIALTYFKESGEIFEAEDYLIGKAYNLGNIGMVFAELDQNIRAEVNINQAVKILEDLGDYSPIAEYLTYMSDIYIDKKDYNLAIKYAQRSLELAIKYDLQKQISESNLQFSELYETIGDTAKALPYYKAYIVYRDSIRNVDNVEKMAAIRNNSEIAQKQVEVELAETRSRTQLIILGFTGVILITLAFFFIAIRKEKQKSEKLLLNILPEETAEELKKSGKVTAKKYDSVSVLFTDFKGFTSYSEKLSPEDLVKTVGYYFSKFDEIIEKYNLEKIKTIGDAYMCAGGIYHNKEEHAQKIIAAALEIAEFVEETKKNAASGELNFDIRIGINSGPVVAGVVGTKKFAYDIWGDTVNLASRMESNGEIGKVNISEATYHIVKDHYNFEYRGEIAVKNKKPQKMYLVKAS